MADENTIPAAAPAASVSQQSPAAAPAEGASSSTAQAETTQAQAPSPEAKQPEQTEILETVLGAEEKTSTEEKPAGEGAAPEKTDAKPEEKTETKDSKPAEGEKKPADGAEKKEATEGEKKEEGAQSAESAQLPSFEPWNFGDGMTVDEARVGEFNTMFAEFARDHKLDTEVMQKFGQQLIDRHVSELKSVVEKIASSYDKVWKDQTKTWYDGFVNDPEIGGNRKDTTVRKANEVISLYGGSEEQRKGLRAELKRTGFGNYPGLIRLLTNLHKERVAEPPSVPATTPVPEQSKSRKQKFYGNKTA